MTPILKLAYARVTSTWTRMIVIGAVIMTILITLMRSGGGGKTPTPYHSPPQYPSPNAYGTVPDYSMGLEPALPALLSQLAQPLKRSIDAKEWTDVDGKVWTLPSAPKWTKPLGRRLAIVDFDTRPLNKEGEATFDGQLDYDKVQVTTAGMLNHYLYAMIHGYDYHFVRISKIHDRALFWSKISGLSDHLHNYDMVISIDADAIFTHLELPFEWLLNRWEVLPGTSLAMSIDPDMPHNLDSKGRRFNNAGFIVAQNNPRTHEILKAWADCPDDIQFPNCSAFKNVQLAEQGGFGEHVRYEYSLPSDLHDLPCNEANGFPEYGHNCDGIFVRHFWTVKHEVRDRVARTYSQFLMSRLHLDFNERARQVIKIRPDNEFHGKMMNQWPGDELPQEQKGSKEGEEPKKGGAEPEKGAKPEKEGGKSEKEGGKN